MNIFNRVMMILAILIVFVVMSIGLVVPQESLMVVKGTVEATLYTLGRIRPEFVLPFRALLILCTVFLDVLLIALLISEVRGPARRAIPVQKVEGGVVAVTVESLAERLRYHLEQLADVVGVKVRVTARGKGADLEINVQTSADMNVPEKAGQVLEIARQVVEDKMGLELVRKPRVYIHATPHPSAAARPMSSPPVALPPTQPTPPPAEPSSSFHRIPGEEG